MFNKKYENESKYKPVSISNIGSNLIEINNGYKINSNNITKNNNNNHEFNNIQLKAEQSFIRPFTTPLPGKRITSNCDINDPKTNLTLLRKNPIPSFISPIKKQNQNVNVSINRNISSTRSYTIESIVQKGSEAYRTKNHTWQVCSEREYNFKISEQPYNRNDIIQLSECLDIILRFLHDSTDSEFGKYLNILKLDYSTIITKVDPDLMLIKQNEQTRKKISDIIYTQKWIDIILGELESLLTVSFVDEGALLRKLRLSYALVFNQIQTTLKECLSELFVTKENSERWEEESLNADARHNAKINDLAEIHQNELCIFKNETKKKQDEYEKKIGESKEQIAKMNEAMKILNSIFKQMREDAENAKAIDYKERNQKLEKECQALKERINSLQPYVTSYISIKNEIEINNEEIERLRHKISELEKDIDVKNKKINELAEVQSQILIDHERKRMSQNVSNNDTSYERTDDSVSISFRKNEKFNHFNSSSSKFCIICGSRLDNKKNMTSTCSNNNTELSGTARFRLLLPDIHGRKPLRDANWTIGCMRQIIHAKIYEEAVNVSNIMSFRVPFVEFVYNWFTFPQDSLPELSYEEQDSLMDEANELRWSFYYGIKILSKESSEAKIFYDLLSKKNGPDELTFVIYCYKIINVMMTSDFSSKTKNFGWYTSYHDFQEHINKYKTTTGNNLTFPTILYCDLDIVLKAMYTVLKKATAEEKNEFEKKLRECSIRVLQEGKDHESIENKVVDVHEWLKLMLTEYRDEQAQRNAVIRLSFQMAASKPSSEGSEDDNSFMDMGQFRTMLRSLCYDIPDSCVATLYLDTYECGKGEITYEAFLKAASSRQFYNYCISFPLFTEVIQQILQQNNNALFNAKIGSVIFTKFILYQKEILFAIKELLPSNMIPFIYRLMNQLKLVLCDGIGVNIDGISALEIIRNIVHHVLRAKAFHDTYFYLTIETKQSSIFKFEKELEYLLFLICDVKYPFLKKLRGKLAIMRLQRFFRSRLKGPKSPK